MTLLLSSVSRFKKAFTYPSSEFNIRKRIFNFRCGDRVLLVSTFFWLLWITYNYQMLLLRPSELYGPENIFSSVFLPAFPSFFCFYSVLCITICCTFFCLYKPGNVLTRFVLSATLLWLNALQWGYGYLSHVGHVFVLAHLLSIFLPGKFYTDKEAKLYFDGIAYYRAGILATYSMAGVWKAGGLLSKVLMPTDDYSWLHEKAFLLNAVVSFRSNDYSFSSFFSFFEIPLVWAFCFILMVFLQIFAFIGAFNDRLHVFIVTYLIAFHLFNSIAFCTVFIWQPLVILILFFPYHRFLKSPDIHSPESGD